MDAATLKQAKNYADKLVQGLGALKGANCTIKSTTPKDNGTEIVFEWTGTSGTKETTTILVKNGEQGNGITKVEKIKTVDLIDTYRMTFDDGSTFDYQINNGGGSSADEKVKLNSTAKEAKYLNELIDNTTIKVDTDNNCLVVKKIEGQTVTVADINFLTGVKSNVQEQINNLGKSMTMYGVFGTKADLLASVDPVPVDGNTAIVVADEDNNNKQMTYIYIASTSKWTQVAESSIKIRDFTTNPINLSTEVTGKLAENKIDTAIARLADVLDKATYKGSSDGVVKQADTLIGLTYTITALNNAIKDSHTHTNKTVLDKIISNGLGSSFLADNGEYISILSIGTSEPTYTSQIWIDNTDTSKLVIKIYDGTDWIAVSGGGGSQSDWEQTDTTAYDYIKNKPTFNELTKADIEAWLGLSPAELEGLASLINDNEIRTDKVWSSSKTYAELQKIAQKAKSAYEIAVKNGFEGTEEQWLESLFPSIDPKTKHWIINGVDTKISAEGRSIKTITKDNNNNIIVTFSDNTTQNIGKLTVDVQGDFLTSDGFGNLRYYNGHFQYFDEASSAWVDTSVTPDNVYVVNMTPQPMQAISCKYDKNTGKLNIKFTEPNDTIVDGQAFCIVEKVIIRRKLGSSPINENDGDFVLEVLRNSFGTYSSQWFTDEGVTPNIDDTYYYKAFPMSTTGFFGYSDLNVAKITCKAVTIYGFKIDQNESDPASMITYLDDCDNAQYASAYMDYTADKFNYGDWGNAWFIKKLKPCMLKYDGTVDYELDKNDYTKKADGTASDVSNTAYEGNAMVGFPKVYWKIVDNGDDTANVYISDTKLDDDFHCWSHIDNNGNEIDYCYMPIYTGGLVNGKLRSLSGLAPMANQTRETEINYAKANNLTDDIIWYTEVYSDRMLINLLLLLIGKSTDTQAVFGTGNSYTDVVSNSGTMDIKGLFWGNQDYSSGIKAFGMEHLWGNTYRAVAGWVYNSGKQKLKLSYGQNDGTTINGYNLDGTGYISIANSAPSGTSGGCISKMLMSEQGIIPIVSNGSASTYYPDIFWFDGSVTAYALLGDSCMKYSNSGKISGAFACALSIQTSFKRYEMCASISCKPLATT